MKSPLMFQKYVPIFFFRGCPIHVFCFVSVGLSPRCGRGGLKSLRDLSAHGNDSVLSCATSWCLNLSETISEADRFSKSSQSAMTKSLDQPPSARETQTD